MPNKFIHPTAVVGERFRYLQGCVISQDVNKLGDIELPDEVYIGPFVLIGLNVQIGNKVVIDAYCKVDSGATIGSKSLVTYRGTIGSGAVVGTDCVVGGNVSEGTKIGNRCRSFGKLIHKHTDSTMSWDFHDEPEPGVTVEDDCFIGHDSTVIGGITIGHHSYICSGALITRDVPPYHIGFGVNQIKHYSEWKGELRDNPMFKEK